MGVGYTYVCKKCGYTFSANLGVGFNYPKLFQEVMKKAKKGDLGMQAKRFLKENPNGVISPRNVIARCEACGEYEGVFDFNMYVPKVGHDPKPSKENWSVTSQNDGIEYVFDFDEYDLKENFDHRCSSCGGKLHVLDEEEPEVLECPHCGEDMLIEGMIYWD